MKIPKEYQSPVTTLRRYWRAYGGSPAVLASPFLHVSGLLAVPCALWPPAATWEERAVAIIPSMLGFTLAGYAILLALGSESFLDRLATRREGTSSPLENISTSYMHFVIVQTMTLSLALIAPSLAQPLVMLVHRALDGDAVTLFLIVIRWLGWMFMLYSMACSLAATFRVFRLVEWFARHVTETPPPHK